MLVLAYVNALLCTFLQDKYIYLEKQSESNPLVVGDVSALVLLIDVRGDDPRMSHFIPHMEGQGPGYRISGVDPAVEVKDVIGHIVCVDAVNGIAHILASGDDYRKGKEDHRADAPVQPEHRGVDVNMTDLNQGLESEEYIKHVGLEARLEVASAVSAARLQVLAVTDKAVEVVEDDEGFSDWCLGDLMWGFRSRSRGRPIGGGRPGVH